MIQSFLSAALYEIVNCLKRHPDFFTMDPASRERVVDAMHVPKPFKNYLQGLKEDSFKADLSGALQMQAHNDLLRALAEFLVGPFAAKLDHLEGRFYLESSKKRSEELRELIKNEGVFYDLCRRTFLEFNYEDLAQKIVEFCRICFEAPYVVVQSARECSSELKKEIRKQVQEKDPLAFPVFQTNRSLIGGLRIFMNGESTDASWVARVHHYLSLTSA